MRAGDAEAFIAIYARYYRLVYAIGRRRLCEPDAVDDIVQSVFLSIWTSSAAFRRKIVRELRILPTMASASSSRLIRE